MTAQQNERSIKEVTVLLALVLVATTLLSSCASGDRRPAPDRAFRVMTYNIHHGEGLDGKVDLERIVNLIKREGADIVALQEVDQGTERTGRRDFPAELARLSGMSCVFSNNYDFQGGRYGNAVLTRFPVKQTLNTHFNMLRPGEQRGILQLVLDVHGRELVFMATHIDFRSDDSERLANAAEVGELLKNYAGKPVILCGDFNDVPGSRTHQKFAELFVDSWTVAGSGDGFTIPAEKPAKRIDYIWLSRDGSIEPLRLWVPTSEASDHLPVVGEFRLR
jgi:endonuclease/exonuclease/phosphatase family metal-dependent hydrolase